MICPECNGRGKSIYYIETQRDENSVTVEQRKGICRTCNGSGKKEQTNADKIRSMTDEELALWICGVYDIEEENGKFINGIIIPGYAPHDIEEWLQQPCEGE